MRKSVSIFTVTVFTIGVMAIFIAGFSGTANAIGSSSNYKSTTLSKEICLAEARKVLENAQFGSISHGTYTITGSRGSYSALIRCIPEKQIVFICVLGPDDKECEKFVNFFAKNGIW
jgi:hypothetical protein